MKVDKKGLFFGMALAITLVTSQIACQQAGGPAAEDAMESGSAAEGSAASAGGSERAAPQPRSATLAAGTALRIRTTSEINTDSNLSGESFTATLEEPLVEGAWVIAPQGSTVEGRIVEADKGGRVQGVARLAIELTQLHTADGQTIEISSNTFTVEADTTKKDDATKIGIGAGLGTVIGAIAGGRKGAAIGAATGAGAGTGVVLATRGDAAVIGSETVLDFELQSPVTITESN
ncbi:MAG: hypothetical protein O7E51_10640 [Acidobacteria bacterium]|nr:hypothetical protein [Acidobacteriota bacterium]